MKKVVILGSTGSIGTQTLDVIDKNKNEFCVQALCAASDIINLEKQIRKFRPEIVCVYNEEKAKELKVNIKDLNIKVVTKMEGLIECATYKDADIVVTAIVGMIGIIPTIKAIQAHKDIALANKETLVTAGHIIMPLVKQYNVKIFPVDSEHSAIFQSLQGNEKKDIEKIILTASGGPFRGKKRSELLNIKVEDALKHPNWSMGKKITIDSSTMVNKGLEIIEAKWLFDIDVDNIEVIIQPQSLIHSMVQYKDGAVIAQLGTPDMRVPIQYALFYPKRVYLDDERVNFFDIGNISFEKPDYDTFKALKLAYKIGKKNTSEATVFNAANERAVAKFLDRKIKYLDIVDIIEEVLSIHIPIENPTIEQILDIEKETYVHVENICKNKRCN